METVFHIVKAVILAVMMYFSLLFLGFSAAPAMIFSLVPLLLGVLNVFTAFAYGLTGLVFIIACATALVPDWKSELKNIWQSAREQVEMNKNAVSRQSVPQQTITSAKPQGSSTARSAVTVPQQTDSSAPTPAQQGAGFASTDEQR